jgi:hypothetical protein
VFPPVVATGAGFANRRAIDITTFSGMVLGILFAPALYAVSLRIRDGEKDSASRPPRKKRTAASATY